MRTRSKHLLAAAAALLTLGAAGFAEAKEERANAMTVRALSGEIVRIRHAGSVPPVVTFAPRARLSAQDVFARDPLWPETDRVFAAMRRHMALMMRGGADAQPIGRPALGLSHMTVLTIGSTPGAHLC